MVGMKDRKYLLLHLTKKLFAKNRFNKNRQDLSDIVQLFKKMVLGYIESMSYLCLKKIFLVLDSYSAHIHIDYIYPVQTYLSQFIYRDTFLSNF